MSAALPLPASGPVRLMPKPILRGCCARAGAARSERATRVPENHATRRFIAVSPPNLFSRFRDACTAGLGCQSVVELGDRDVTRARGPAAQRDGLVIEARGDCLHRVGLEDE